MSARSRQASPVGRATIPTPRRSASAWTSAAIGSLPSAPVPTDEPLATPRDDLRGRQRRVSELITERLRRALSAAADTPAVDDHVAGITLALDLNLAERDELCLHGRSFAPDAGGSQRGSHMVGYSPRDAFDSMEAVRHPEWQGVGRNPGRSSRAARTIEWSGSSSVVSWRPRCAGPGGRSCWRR
jgi:hypothetical protein